MYVCMYIQVPKIDAATLKAVDPPSHDPSLAWCPPGHGDIYAALLGSGTLDSLRQQGISYLFVSNSDNLGASLDVDLLAYLAESNKGFVMECAQRTESDKKGGHLCRYV